MHRLSPTRPIRRRGFEELAQLNDQAVPLQRANVIPIFPSPRLRPKLYPMPHTQNPHPLRNAHQRFDAQRAAEQAAFADAEKLRN